MSGDMTMTIKKKAPVEAVATKTATKKPIPRKRVAKPKAVVEAPVAPLSEVQPQEELQTFKPDFLPIAQKLIQQPDQGVYIMITNNVATLLGFQVDISNVVDMAAIAVYKAYTELPQEQQQELSLEQVAAAMHNRLLELGQSQENKNADSNLAEVQETL